MEKALPAVSIELKRLRNLAGLSIRAVADKVGLSSSGYAHYENEFKEDHLPWALVKLLIPVFQPLGVDPDELRRLAMPTEAASNMVNIHTPQIHLPAFGERDLPVYGAALGGDGAVMLNRGDEVDRIHRPPMLIGVKDAFGVVVSGDSMEPMFLQGDIAWIHPGRPPMPRRGVLIELHDGHAHLKEYISQNDDVVRCRQHNPPTNVTFKRRDVKRLYLVVGSGLYG